MASLLVNVTEAVRPEPGHRHTRFAIEVCVSVHQVQHSDTTPAPHAAPPIRTNHQLNKEWTLHRKYYEFNRLYRALVSLGFPCPKIPLRTMWIANAAIRPSIEILQRRVVSLDMWLQATLSTWRDHFLISGSDAGLQDKVTRSICTFLSDDSNSFSLPPSALGGADHRVGSSSGLNPRRSLGNAFKLLAQRLFRKLPASQPSDPYYRNYYPNLVGGIQQEEELSLVSLPAVALTPPPPVQNQSTVARYQRTVVIRDDDGDELTWVFEKTSLTTSKPAPQINFVRNVLEYVEDGGMMVSVVLDNETPGVDLLEGGFDMSSVPGTPKSRAQFQAPWREFTNKLVTHADQRMKRAQLFQETYARTGDSGGPASSSFATSTAAAAAAAAVDSGSEEGGSECGGQGHGGDGIPSRFRALYKYAMHQQDEADERNSEGWVSEAASEAMGMNDDMQVLGQFDSGGMVWIAPKSAPPTCPPVLVPNPMELAFSDEDDGEEGDDESDESSLQDDDESDESSLQDDDDDKFNLQDDEFDDSDLSEDSWAEEEENRDAVDNKLEGEETDATIEQGEEEEDGRYVPSASDLARV
ncbi:hypothetical protein BASA81_004460 [Batrachochytrium salamandrivorans]|nr:hypothetical protein BASA81_004460 [Batrachochytrium salamandrivorans]